ncbi:MAG: SCO family protein [Pseudomonadota bacterium]
MQGFAALLALCAVVLTRSAAVAGEARLDPDAALARSEAAIGQMVGPHVLNSSTSAPLALASLRGRPLVISLIYTSCSHVCPLTTQHVRRMVEAARRVLGEDAFAVLTVGFDSRRDSPGRLAAFASAQGIGGRDWYLASGDEATIAALARDLGFSYQAGAGGFVHVTQTTILDGEGRVYRQVYGADFPEQVFIEPLKELVFGTPAQGLSLSGLVNRIKFLCTVYNPSSGAYEFDYAIGFGIVIGGFSLMVMGVIVFRLWRSNRRLLASLEDGSGGRQGR